MKILFAINEPIEDYHIVHFYLNSLENPNDELVLAKVFVAPKIPVTSYYPGPIILNEDYIYESYRLEEKNMKELKRFTSQLISQYGKDFDYRLLDPNGYDVGEALINYSKSIKVDMIIISSRQRGAVKDFFLGSTSTYVVHHSTIPVTVCPKTQKTHRPE